MQAEPRHQAVLGKHFESLGLPLADLNAPGATVEQMGDNTVAACLCVLAGAAVTIYEHGFSGLSSRPGGVAAVIEKRTNRL